MRFPAIIGVLALLAAPVVAHAQSTSGGTLVAELKSVCVAAKGDRAAALAIADKDGWSPVPEAMLAQIAGKVQDPAGRLKTDSTGFRFLLVGSDTRAFAGKPVKVSLCAVGAATEDKAGVTAALQTLVGKTAPSSEPNGASLWAFTETGAGPQPLDPKDDKAVDAAVQTGTARLLAQQTVPVAAFPSGVTIIAYAVPAR